MTKNKLTFQEAHTPIRVDYSGSNFPKIRTETPTKDEMDKWSRERLEQELKSVRLHVGIVFMNPISSDTPKDLRLQIADERRDAIKLVQEMETYYWDRIMSGAGRQNEGDIVGTTHPPDGTTIVLENKESRAIRMALDTLGQRYDLMPAIKRVREITETLAAERRTASDKGRPPRTTGIQLKLDEAMAVQENIQDAMDEERLILETKLAKMFREPADAIVKAKNAEIEELESFALWFLLRAMEFRSLAHFTRSQANSVVAHSGIGVRGDVLRPITDAMVKAWKSPTDLYINQLKGKIDFATPYKTGELADEEFES